MTAGTSIATGTSAFLLLPPAAAATRLLVVMLSDFFDFDAQQLVQNQSPFGMAFKPVSESNTSASQL